MPRGFGGCYKRFGSSPQSGLLHKSFEERDAKNMGSYRENILNLANIGDRSPRSSVFGTSRLGTRGHYEPGSRQPLAPALLHGVSFNGPVPPSKLRHRRPDHRVYSTPSFSFAIMIIGTGNLTPLRPQRSDP